MAVAGDEHTLEVARIKETHLLELNKGAAFGEWNVNNLI